MNKKLVINIDLIFDIFTQFAFHLIQLQLQMERIRPNSQLNNNSRNGRNCEDNEKTSIWTAIFEYEASGEDELTLKRGDRVEVLSMDTKISGDEG